MTTTSTTSMTSTPPSKTAAPPGVGSARPGRQILRPAARLLSPVAVVVLWQLLCSTGVLPPDVIASPAEVARTAGRLLQDGTLTQATGISLRRAALGFVVGGALGVALAVVAGLSTLGELVLDPPLQMLRTLPLFGLIPLFIIWFGINETPKVALIALGVLFPLYLNTFAGIRSVDRRLVEAARAMDLTAAQRLRHVILPGALPQTLVGLRQSLGIAWLSLIVAEQISASSGLGFLINNAREFQQIDVVLVGLVVYALLGLLTDSAVRIIERKALSWRA